MAGAKALRTAAGLLGPKKSTATEPATSSSLLQERKKSTATEPATKKRRKERKEKRRKEKKKRRRGETSSSQPEPDPLPLTGRHASASADQRRASRFAATKALLLEDRAELQVAMRDLEALQASDATAEQIHEQRFVVQTMLTQMNELLQRSSTKMWCGDTTPLLTECRGAVDEDRFQDSLELCVRFVESQQWLDQLELLGHPPAEERDPLPLIGLQASASEDGFLLGNKDLEKIVALLLWMAKDFQSNIDINDIHYAALEVIIKHSDAATGGALGLLHTASVAKLSELIDIMMLHKDGSPKDANETLDFMRQVAKIREKGLACLGYRATERVELDQNEVSKCYQLFGRALCTHNLLPHQKKDEKYGIRNNFEGDTYLSTFQRSFTDNMLRKSLGDKKTAILIWQHGLPKIADLPAHSKIRNPRVNSKRLDMGMLQSGLDECLQWYTCLANNIVVHQTQEGFDAQLSASSLDEQEQQRQQTRREALQKARDALRLGAALAKQRDDRKRSYDDMNDAEQKTLEDYETGRAKRTKQSYTIPRMNPFRCNVPSMLHD